MGTSTLGPAGLMVVSLGFRCFREEESMLVSCLFLFLEPWESDLLSSPPPAQLLTYLPLSHRAAGDLRILREPRRALAQDLLALDGHVVL